MWAFQLWAAGPMEYVSRGIPRTLEFFGTRAFLWRPWRIVGFCRAKFLRGCLEFIGCVLPAASGRELSS